MRLKTAGTEGNIVDVGLVGLSVSAWTEWSLGIFSFSLSARLAGVPLARPRAAVDALLMSCDLSARVDSGGGIASHRTWVGCMILGYCMVFVWMSYWPSRFSRRAARMEELNRL